MGIKITKLKLSHYKQVIQHKEIHLFVPLV